MVQDLSGIERDAQTIITQRRRVLNDFLALQAKDWQSFGNEEFHLLDKQKLFEIVLKLEQRAYAIDEEKSEQRSTLALSLARTAAELGLYIFAEEQTWQECWRGRLFDRPRSPAHRIDKFFPDARRPEQPETRYIVRAVHQLLAEINLNHDDPKTRLEHERKFIVELERQQLCRNSGTAHAVFAIIQGSKSTDKRNAIRKAATLKLFARLPKPATASQPPSTGRPLKRRKRPFVPQHPKWEKLLVQLRSIRNANAHNLSDPSWLVQAGMVPTSDAANAVVAALDRSIENASVNWHARNLLLYLLKTYCGENDFELLLYSAYLQARLVIEVEQRIQRAAISYQQPLPITQIREDCLAVNRAAIAVCPEHWNYNLLQAGPATAPRTFHQGQITTVDRNLIIRHLMELELYNQKTATDLLHTVLDAGIEGVIDWRVQGEAELAGDRAQERRLRIQIGTILSAIPQERQEVVVQDALNLRAALRDAGINVALDRVIREMPSSHFRRRLKRRIPVGYGVVQYLRSKAARRKRRHLLVVVQEWNKDAASPESPIETGNRLVECAVRHFSYSPEDVASMLNDVWTYGAIGFIPKAEWLELIHPNLISLLKLYKFGRIEGRFQPTIALAKVNEYAQLLGLPLLSPQLARAILGLLNKPRRWNSGEGEKVAHVRKRAGLVLPGTPWLHRVWRVFVFRLPLPLSESPYGGASTESWLTLVVDLGSQLPVGSWVSATPPEERELRLALFQAIWHPGAIDWPLRGVPEILQVPDTILSEGSQSFEQDVTWLLAHVQLVQDDTQIAVLKNMPTATEWIQNLYHSGLESLGSTSYPTVKQAHESMIKWLRESPVCLRNINPGSSDTSRLNGFSTPGFATQAAGAVLPLISYTTTVRDGVIMGQRRYNTTTTTLAPGLRAEIRSFPYRYIGLAPDEQMQDAMFVRDSSGLLHYLTSTE